MYVYMLYCEGYFFGETDILLNNEIREYTAIAISDCEIYLLDKKDFKRTFLMEFREIGLELYLIAI